MVDQALRCTNCNSHPEDSQRLLQRAIWTLEDAIKDQAKVEILNIAAKEPASSEAANFEVQLVRYRLKQLSEQLSQLQEMLKERKKSIGDENRNPADTEGKEIISDPTASADASTAEESETPRNSEQPIVPTPPIPSESTTETGTPIDTPAESEADLEKTEEEKTNEKQAEEKKIKEKNDAKEKAFASILKMTGQEELKKHLKKTKDRIDNCTRDGSVLSSKGFGVVLIGPSRSGMFLLNI